MNSARHFLAADFEKMEKHYRTHFFNSLTGFKSLTLVGSVSSGGQTNLAVFSNVFHLGAHPSLMGMIVRPASVSRHTLTNIEDTKYYTFNHVKAGFYEKAHQTAARYPKDVSEFEAVGLKPLYSPEIPAPYVAESNIRIGLKWRETILIPSNQTLLVVGEVVEVCLPETCLSQDGFINLELAGSLTVSGLDSYHQTHQISRLAYAKPNTAVRTI